jgi:hypothetical protein
MAWLVAGLITVGTLGLVVVVVAAVNHEEPAGQRSPGSLGSIDF